MMPVHKKLPRPGATITRHRMLLLSGRPEKGPAGVGSILECMGGTSHPDHPPGHPTTDLSICGPIPPSCRCGRQPGQVSGKQVAACGLGQAPCRKGEMKLAYINMDKTGRADVCHGDHTPR